MSEDKALPPEERLSRFTSMFNSGGNKTGGGLFGAGKSEKKTTGTRVIIVYPKPELVDSINNGGIILYIQESWWIIIQRFDNTSRISVNGVAVEVLAGIIMAKPTPDFSIPKEKNIKILLGEKNVCKEICSITYDELSDKSNMENVLERVDAYYNTMHDSTSDKVQCGKVWFLVKKQGESLEVLQVAQSIDYDINQSKGFFDEIYSHIKAMFSDKEQNLYRKFACEIKVNGEIIFCELNIEEYISVFVPTGYKEFIYRMAQEYFTEASIVHFTQSREWGFYNSGMDKRALYYLYANIESKEIDKQKVE